MDVLVIASALIALLLALYLAAWASPAVRRPPQDRYPRGGR